MANKRTKVLNAQDTLARNIVDSIKAGRIQFGDEVKVSAKDNVGVAYKSKKLKSGAIVEVKRVKFDGANNFRTFIKLSYSGTVKGMVKSNLISGLYAGQAYKAITHVPKPKKVVISSSDLALANKAFGF